MYDHIGLKVKNLDASVRFYGAALAPLGHVLASRDASGAGLGAPGEPALWLYLAKNSAGPGIHVAFRAADRAAVDRFHAEGLAAGGRGSGTLLNFVGRQVPPCAWRSIKCYRTDPPLLPL